MFRLLENLVDPFMDRGQPFSGANAIRYIRTQLAPFRVVIALSVAATIASVCLELALFAYAARLVDTLVAQPPETLWAERGGEFLLVGLGVLVLRPLIGFAKEGIDDIAFRPNAVGLFRWRAHHQVMRQPVSWFRTEPSGRLGSRVREVGVSAAGATYSFLHTILTVLIYIAGSVILVASVDLLLAIPVALWAVLYIGHMAYTVPRFRDKHEAFNGALSRLTALLVDTYSNIETIRVYANPDRDDPEFLAAFRAARRTFFDVQRFEVITNVGMLTLGTILLVGLVGYGIVLWQMGLVPVGFVAAALALSLRINAMAEWMLDGVASFFGYLGATKDSLKSIGQPLAMEDRTDPAFHTTTPAIELDAVTHRHGRSSGGLANLSLVIQPGEKLGIVGPSGGGKSTLVGALLRQFDPEAGRILLDGRDIRFMPHKDLLRNMAVVAQEPALLNRSIRDNIAYGRDAAPQDEVERVSRQVGAHDFIIALQDDEGRQGYDAHTGERGLQLSGGQRQRIAIARALLKDAPVVLLDEATSALDAESEAKVLDALHSSMEGRTVIAVAHRLSTLSRMDRILVIDQGAVIESGSHEELLERGGLYSRLWTHQVQTMQDVS